MRFSSRRKTDPKKTKRINQWHALLRFKSGYSTRPLYRLVRSHPWIQLCQLTLTRKPGYLFPNTSIKMKDGQACFHRVIVNKFELVGEAWVPTEGRHILRDDMISGQWSEAMTTYKRDEIKKQLDFDKEKAFTSDDVRDGTIVRYVDWRPVHTNGKRTPYNP